jgi:hypothetical protein
MLLLWKAPWLATWRWERYRASCSAACWRHVAADCESPAVRRTLCEPQPHRLSQIHTGIRNKSF